MAQTKLANVVNREVLADMIQAELPKAIRFSNSVASIDMSLVAQPGDTVRIPVWAYIGNAADLAEGVADIPVLLEASSTTATVKKAAKAVELTDETALSGYGDPMGEAARQVAMSLGGKVDADVLAALKTATLTAGTNLIAISYPGIVAATMKFKDEQMGEQKFLFVNPLQYGEILLDTRFEAAAPEVVRSGIVGRIAGCDVMVSKQLADGEALIAKNDAVKIYMKRDVNVETDRNVLAKTNIIAADQHYVAVLKDASKAVKYTVKPTV